MRGDVTKAELPKDESSSLSTAELKGEGMKQEMSKEDAEGDRYGVREV